MSQRTERVEKLARQVLGESISELKDPRIGFATVTRVRITADLRHARVLVSVLGDESEQDATIAGLNSAKPVLRAELGRQVRMKYLPELIFELDRGTETAERVERLLHEIERERKGEEMRWNVDDWDATVETLRSAKAATLACHVNPDGDALGSLLATHLGLKKMGVGSTPTWGTSPAKIPFAYTWIPGAQDIVQPEDAPAAEVFIALDCGAADRLGDLEGPAHASKRLINVDHHPGNENFGHLNVVVPDASSTAELVAGLLQDAGVEFDRDIATCLYAGIVTDTGRFQYSNSTPATLRLAADLLEYDVPAPAIAQEVFESSPFAYLKLVGHVLERAVLHPDASFVYSWFTRSDLEESGVDMDETEKLIDLVRSTRDADVAAMFKEQPDGRWRVSMRSKSGVSVGALARARGGGGHELAAGFTAPDLEATVASLLDELRGAA